MGRRSVQPDNSIHGVADFIQRVDDIWQKWSDEYDYWPDIWFRGHSDDSWTLKPGWYRNNSRSVREWKFRREFQLRASPFLGEATIIPTSDWDWYFLMQHFGMPTRLLDWTESALAALYFATETTTDKPNAPGAVWVLDPKSLNSGSSLRSHIPMYTDKRVAPYLPSVSSASRFHKLPKKAIAIEPTHNSRRLAAQRGKFTVHGAEHTPLESTDPKLGLLKLTIPAAAKQRMRRQLHVLGVTEGVLFPSLAGLSREIRDGYESTWET